MIRLVRFECIKIWSSRRFLAALAALFALNFFLLWLLGGFDAGAVSAYRELSGALNGLNPDEKLAFIDGEAERARALAVIDEVVTREERDGIYDAETRSRYPELFTEPYLRLYFSERSDPGYTGNLAENASFILRIKNEADEVSGHPEFILEMEQKAARLSGISIFQSDETGFDALNISASAKAYARLRGVEIDYYPQAGLQCAINFGATDWLLLGAALFVALTALSEEREKGLLRLTRSTPAGKRKTAAAKIAAVLLSLMACVILFYGSNLSFCSLALGLGDLSRSVQSAPFLMHSVLRVSVGEYILLFLAAKSAALICTALIMMAVCLFLKRAWSAFLTVFAVLGASFLIRAVIPATGRLALIKYANPISALNTNELLGVYFNINILDRPCSRFAVEFIAILLFIVSAALLFVLAYPKRAARDAQRNARLAIGLDKIRCKSVPFTEAYKLLGVNGAAAVLALFLLFQLLSGFTEEIYLPSDELRYRTYMQQISGRYDTDAYEWLYGKGESFRPLRELEAQRTLGLLSDQEYALKSAQYDELLRDYAVFVRVAYGNLPYVVETKGAYLVYDSGYPRFFDVDGTYSAREALYCMIVLTLCISDVVAKEKRSGMLKLIKTTPLGRRYTFRCRMKLCAAAACLAAVTSLAARWIAVVRFYGLPGFFYPLNSLAQFSSASRLIGIWMLALFALLSRCIGAALAAAIMSAVSCKAPNTAAALAANTAIFCAPLVMSELIDEQFKYLSAYPLFSAPELLKTGGQAWVYFLIAAVLAVYGCYSASVVSREFG